MQTRFSLDVSRWVEKVGGDASTVIKKIAFDIGARIIMRTPVDTGRARGNWLLGIGRPQTHASGKVDGYKSPPNGTGSGDSIAKEDLLSGLGDYDPKSGESIFLTNSVPYIGRLEYGSSKQAPSGMVRVTLTEFGAVVDKAVKSTRHGGGLKS